jgi:uncharacterized membrane protein YphA (DoxX/SURF4 family)
MESALANTFGWIAARSNRWARYRGEGRSAMRWLHFPPVLMLAVFAPAALAWRWLDPAGRPPFLVYGARWFLGLLFLISGLAKLIPHFPNTMGPVNLEAVLEPHGLALYARFIAVAELGTGALLLTRRFATLGALMLVPILANILVITSALQWVGTPYVVSGFLLIALGLLVYDYPKLAMLVADRPTAGPTTTRQLLLASSWLAGLGLLTGLFGMWHFASPAVPGVWVLLALLVALVIVEWRRRDG